MNLQEKHDGLERCWCGVRLREVELTCLGFAMLRRVAAPLCGCFHASYLQSCVKRREKRELPSLKASNCFLLLVPVVDGVGVYDSSAVNTGMAESEEVIMNCKHCSFILPSEVKFAIYSNGCSEQHSPPAPHLLLFFYSPLPFSAPKFDKTEYIRSG